MSSISPRRLKAMMVLRGLSLREVSERSGVDYVTCSQLLNGRVIRPEKFRLVQRAITSAPEPAQA